ncbi:MAG: response regulator [Elusimicrobia bacterium]|nr:response regulator [Elusimicrobiota bacterium]
MADGRAERTFTTFEVARLCGAYHSTVERWIAAGRLKAVAGPGGRLRVAHADLLAFMRSCDLLVPALLESASRRILIIDDDPVITRLLERCWDHAPDSYEISAVNDPVTGLIEIGRFQPDVLVLDLLMPMLSGYDVCRILKADPATRRIRILAMTAGSPDEGDMDFLIDHADMVVPKPFDPRRLAGAVEELMESR